MRRRRICAVICLITLLACCGCQARTGMVNRTAMDFMDTVSTITVPASRASAAEQVFAMCRDLDARWSARSADSEIGRLNAGQGAEVPLSADTLELLRRGQAYAEMSGGLLDITIGPASLLWNFTAKEPALPDPAELAEAVDRVGIDALTVGEGFARLDPGGAVDLGALAKGEALDRSVDLLRSLGVETALVNLGGSVYALGKKPDGSAWRVAVQRPFGGQGGYVGVVTVTDLCVVTAGVYERGFTLDGTYYHHILDPKTGMPCQTDLLSATIVYGEGVTADAASTICILLGSEKAMEWVEKMDGMECILVCRDGSLRLSPGIGSGIPFEES
ncbi:MAG TPA: FAD:protein FMN transferase, partial [Clostridia bacterium]|nr:FAD:protein FMN transferase [Clostridia bacterium]